jgi:hypothetical protein
MKLALIRSDLDLFAIMLGYVCADVMLASRDGWEDGSGVKLWERRLVWSGLLGKLLRVTCCLTGGVTADSWNTLFHGIRPIPWNRKVFMENAP